MAWPPWFKERLAQADLVNLGVIFAFAILLGVGGVAAMQGDVDPGRPVEPIDEDDEGDDSDDDDDSKGRDGKGKDHDKDDDGD